MLKLVAAALVLFAADTPPTTTIEAIDHRTVVVDLKAGRREGGEQARARATRRTIPRTPAVEQIIAVQLRLDPETGARCAYVYSIPGDPNGDEAEHNEALSLRWIAEYGLCSNSPNRPRPRPRTTTTPEEAAATAAWREQVTLPDPQPHVAPGWAITGKAAYLELRGPDTITGTFHALGYDVEITARHHSIDVDWGDGTTDKAVTHRPAPWPDGQITHTYRYARPARITVTRHWTATWRIGAATGTISEPLSTTATLDLDVRQLEAIRTR